MDQSPVSNLLSVNFVEKDIVLLILLSDTKTAFVTQTHPALKLRSIAKLVKRVFPVSTLTRRFIIPTTFINAIYALLEPNMLTI